MKNILGFFSIALIAISLVSCEKEYNCKCTITDTNGLVPETTFSNIITGKKKDAESICSASSLTVDTIVTTCELE